MPVTDTRKSLLGLHVGTLLLAGTALFPKLISLPADQIIALRSLIAALALLVYVRLAAVSLAVPARRDRGWVLLIGALMAGHWVALFFSIQLTTVAVGLICLFTFPVMVVFLEPWFLGERLHARDVLVAAAAVLGVYLVIEAGGVEPGFGLGVVLGLGSALIYSLRHVLYRRHLQRYPSSAMMFYQACIAAVVTFPALWGGVDLGTDWRWLYLLALGVLFTAVPHTLLANSLRYLSAKTVSLITSLQPVYGAVLAVLILSEWPTLRTVAGGALIVAAAAYESRRASAR